MVQNFLNRLGSSKRMVLKKDPSDKLSGGGWVPGEKEFSFKHIFKLLLTNWIKKSTLLLRPNLNFRRSALVFKPFVISKLSLYQDFWPKAGEPYLKARAELMDDCRSFGYNFNARKIDGPVQPQEYYS